ncbi:hypothetical protein EJ06DRAFT_580022 [Trichodelitschia bisporula]|uniref:Mediator of RNA polymerase II transcription subunit 8 n=1 Tax=Trichodelitschia bisporula TaxID=703511 RepID=A0A6G1I3R3_9PEZI|nr:hypothetical protein EJ06DRAFT_580022 [Trichodelitschia bisporula]
MDDVDPDELRTLDQIRQHLLNLSLSMQSLQKDLVAQEDPRYNPLPSKQYLVSAEKAVKGHLESLHRLLSENAQFLREAHVYPTAQFPWNQEHLATMLLRKRLDPGVETWLAQGREATEALSADSQPDAMDYDGPAKRQQFDPAYWQDLWDFAAPETHQAIQNTFADVEGNQSQPSQTRRPPPPAPEVKELPLDDVLRVLAVGITPVVQGPFAR